MNMQAFKEQARKCLLAIRYRLSPLVPTGFIQIRQTACASPMRCPGHSKSSALPRFSYSSHPSKKCRTLIASKRVLTTILAEAYANGENETGGILLGHQEEGVWYLVEATGPGYGAYHTPTRHEMNKRFVNYLYRVLFRIYDNGPLLIGFWHRHPGNFNRFSDLDDKVNTDYAKAIGNGTLSILLNFTPDPQFTCYYLDPDDACYHPVKLVINNRKLAKKGFLAYTTPEELRNRAQDMQEAMEDIA